MVTSTYYMLGVLPTCVCHTYVVQVNMGFVGKVLVVTPACIIMFLLYATMLNIIVDIYTPFHIKYKHHVYIDNTNT